MTCCAFGFGQFDDDEDVEQFYTEEIAVYGDRPPRRQWADEGYEPGYYAFPVEEQLPQAYPAPYGYPQAYPAPYGYPQAPYGYPQAPYGYAPAPYGYPDPYAQAAMMPAEYAACASKFPPGTPQSVIDAVCGMAAGVPDAGTISQAAQTLADQGQQRALEAFLAKLRQYPGFSEGEPTPADIARGCKPVTFSGQVIGKLCPTAGQPATAQTQQQQGKPQTQARLGKVREWTLRLIDRAYAAVGRPSAAKYLYKTFRKKATSGPMRKSVDAAQARQLERGADNLAVYASESARQRALRFVQFAKQLARLVGVPL